MMKKPIDVLKITQTIDNTLEELKTQYDPNQLTKVEKEAINIQIDEIIRLALFAKLQLKYDQLKNTITQYNLTEKANQLSLEDLTIMEQTLPQMEINAQQLNNVLNKVA